MESGYNLPTFTSEGAQVVSLTYAGAPQVATWKQRKHPITAGQTNFFDIQITQEVRVQGGAYYIDNFSDVHQDDYIEFSIIDKNDILGLFSLYGLNPGDVLELAKFIRNEFPLEHGYNFDTTLGCAWRVYPGLFLRVSYVSFGEVDINLKTRILWYE